MSSPLLRRSLIRAAGASLLAAALPFLATGAGSAAVPYDVQVILPLSGSNAFVGSKQREALSVLQEMVNRTGGIKGRPLNFVISDSQSNPQLAVQLASGIIARHVPIFVGDSSVATCSAIAALVQQSGPVQICLSPGYTPARGGYAYAFGESPDAQARGAARFLRARGLHRVALMVLSDATGIVMSQAFISSFKGEGLDLVATERFNPTDISVAAQIAQIKAASPQALVAFVSGPQFGTVARGLQDAGLDIPVLTSQGNLAYAELKQFGDILPKTLLFISGPLPSEGESATNGPTRSAQIAYLNAFRGQGIKPDFGDAVAWDTGNIVVAALRGVGPDPSANEIRAYINTMHGFPGIQGLYDFRNGDNRGISESDVRLLQWDAAKGAWFDASIRTR